MNAARDINGTMADRRADALDAAGVLVRKMTMADIGAALRLGWDDFMSKPSHYVMLALIYPIAGLIFAAVAAGYNLLPIVFPVASGFALIGPLAAIAFYEISREREVDGNPAWGRVLALRSAPHAGSLRTMGLILGAAYLVWLIAAYAIYRMTFGYWEPSSFAELVSAAFTTPQGLALVVIGNLVGAVFAIAVLLISVVSFPMILDRKVDVGTAIRTSLAVAEKNPAVVLAWGLTVAVLLVLGSLPLFVGLALVVPLLGHASWHLYRRAVIDRTDAI